MSSFFTIPASQRKRKREETTSSGGQAPKRNLESRLRATSKPQRTRPKRDESISGSDSDDEDGGRKRAGDAQVEDSVSSDSNAGEETGAERRLRLAERYLKNIREEVQDEVGFDAAEIDKDLIAERLKEDVAESKGRLYRHIASSYLFPQASRTFFRSKTGPTTSIAAHSSHVYTVAKDRTLTKWELPSPPPPLPNSNKKGKKPKESDHSKVVKSVGPLLERRRPTMLHCVKNRGEQQKGWKKGDKTPKNAKRAPSTKAPSKPAQPPSHHSGPILCVAASPDGQYVATGGADSLLIIWSASTLKPLRVFTQHRDAVTSLAFRRPANVGGSTASLSNQLYSASKDRTIKTWSINEFAYVETLFGHQDEVLDVAALAQERCLSVGARDRTARLWKVVEETQLVFRGGGGGGGNKKDKGKAGSTLTSKNYIEGSIDRVAMIDEDTFVTGSDNGSISLWNVQKKKPVFTVPQAHGLDPLPRPEDISPEEVPKQEDVMHVTPQPRWITALATVPYSDLVISGSWDGWLRAWKVGEDRRKLESLGVIGAIADMPQDEKENGDDTRIVEGASIAAAAADDDDDKAEGTEVIGPDTEMDLNAETNQPQSSSKPVKELHQSVRGIINDIKVFERGDKGKESLCIVAAVGTEHRLGRWKVVGGRNGAVMYEAPKVRLVKLKKNKKKNKPLGRRVDEDAVVGLEDGD
ncbi:pre-rRNA processing protein [Agyrium rufum]|nr:pre-rRNA processing protein [Agyrium rufum]